jgi:excisionase family DNA binding protein
MSRSLSLDEIRAWPAAVDVEDGCAALGISRAHGYKAVQDGEFPARVIKVGRRYRVVTADLVALLEPQGSAA